MASSSTPVIVELCETFLDEENPTVFYRRYTRLDTSLPEEQLHRPVLNRVEIWKIEPAASSQRPGNHETATEFLTGEGDEPKLVRWELVGSLGTYGIYTDCDNVERFVGVRLDMETNVQQALREASARSDMQRQADEWEHDVRMADQDLWVDLVESVSTEQSSAEPRPANQGPSDQEEQGEPSASGNIGTGGDVHEHI